MKTDLRKDLDRFQARPGGSGSSRCRWWPDDMAAFTTHRGKSAWDRTLMVMTAP